MVFQILVVWRYLRVIEFFPSWSFQCVCNRHSLTSDKHFFSGKSIPINKVFTKWKNVHKLLYLRIIRVETFCWHFRKWVFDRGSAGGWRHWRLGESWPGLLQEPVRGCEEVGILPELGEAGPLRDLAGGGGQLGEGHGARSPLLWPHSTDTEVRRRVV